MKKKVWIIDVVLIVLTLSVGGFAINEFLKEDVSLSPDFDFRTKILFSFSGVEKIFVGDVEYLIFDGQVIEMKEGLNYLKLNYETYEEIRKIELEEDLNFVLSREGDNYFVLVADGDYGVDVYDGRGDYSHSLLLEGKNE